MRETPKPKASDIAGQGSAAVLTVLRLAHVITKRSAELTAGLGVTPQQWLVLAALSLYERPPLLTELGRALLVSKQNAAGMVERLAEIGFLERFADPANKHLVRIRLTKSGIRLVERLQPRQDHFVEATFGQLSRADRRALSGALARFFAKVADGA